MNIYMIGICGVAMGSLAGMLKAMGHNVSGSDAGIYPPMSDKLAEWGIKTYNGYNANNIAKPDLVIIGNAISRGNAEAEFVLDSGLPYLSMAQALYSFFLKDKETISVAGTHGKTTSTAILYHILETAGEDPSCFIGGVSKNLDSNFKIGNGKYFVIEGDEYDSAFFEKIPKFIVYRPRHLVLTSLEFDHADIYNSLEEIKLWFRRLVNIVPSSGNIVYSSEYENLAYAVEKSLSKCVAFGKDNSPYRFLFSGYSGQYSHFSIISEKFGTLDLKTKLFGDYNFANITGCAAMALELGIDAQYIKRAVESFTGVKRRQELMFQNSVLRIYEDFAHHPTAIRFFLDELKKRFPDSVIWAIYEPRSATSRRNIFQNELPSAFGSADIILIKNPFNLEAIPQGQRIEIDKVVNKLKQNKKAAYLFDNVESIIDHVFNNLNNKNDVIAVMSNGSFDGIYSKIISRAGSLNEN